MPTTADQTPNPRAPQPPRMSAQTKRPNAARRGIENLDAISYIAIIKGDGRKRNCLPRGDALPRVAVCSAMGWREFITRAAQGELADCEPSELSQQHHGLPFDHRRARRHPHL